MTSMSPSALSLPRPWPKAVTSGVVATVFMMACTSSPSSRPSQQHDPADDAIARVERNLRPRLWIDGERTTFTLASRMQHHHVVGVSIAVIDGGSLVWAKGYGVTTAGTSRAITAGTLFEAASVSKVVAAMGSLAMVRRGRLALDEDVNRRLRSWHVAETAATRKRKITLRALASHSAGLASPSGAHWAPGENVPTLPQILDGVAPARHAPARVEVPPGTRSQYSNSGYNILQVLMTDVAGRPFPDLMRALVLDPLGMRSSFFEQPPATAEALAIAAPHDGQGQPMAGLWHRRPEMAAGGLRTTPSDLAQVVVELLRLHAGGEGKVLDRAHASLMLTRQFGDWGFGLELGGSGPTLRFAHSGSNDGYKARLVGFPELGKGAVILATGDHGARRLTDELLRALAAVYDWPAYAAESRDTVSVDPRVLATYAGTYDLGGDLLVTHEDGQLFLTPPGGTRDRLLPSSARDFFLIDEPMIVAFEGTAAPYTLRLTFPDGTTAKAPRR